MGILPWWLPWKNDQSLGGLGTSGFRYQGTLSCPVSSTCTAHCTQMGYLPGGPRRASFFLATSISEDPTEIELCKLHAMNSTR